MYAKRITVFVNDLLMIFNLLKNSVLLINI